MKILPFKELVALTQKGIDKAMAPIRAKQLQSQAELEMLKIDAEILTTETDIQETFTNKDVKEIYLPGILDKLDRIAILERRKAQYKKLLDSLFPV